MLSANAFTIRPARKSDDPTLAWLAALSSRPAVARPALIGDIDGIPAAALSLVDGRVVADPFRPTSVLCADLRLHRSGWRARTGREGARKHVRALLPFFV
jgi:hypothetical protein